MSPQYTPPQLQKSTKQIAPGNRKRLLASSEHEDTVELEFQGSLVQAKVVGVRTTPLKHLAHRGAVTSFSRRSRTRLIKRVARLSVESCKTSLLTLTYPAKFPEPKTAKSHRRSFEKRLDRLFPDAKWSAVWRMEFQERGAPHFHLMCFGLPFIPKELVQQLWGEVIGTHRPFTRIELIRSKRGVMSYVSKYVAKIGGESGSGFNYVPYLSARPKSLHKFWRAGFISALTIAACWLAFDESESQDVGRFWGITHKENLPLAALECVTITAGDLDAYYEFRRGAGKHYSRLKRQVRRGFFILCNSPPKWLEFLYFCCLNGKDTQEGVSCRTEKDLDRQLATIA